MWGEGGGQGETNHLSCANDEKVQINDSSRRRGVWSNRGASQMRLTQGIVNAYSTLQNIISPRLPPRCTWKLSKLVWSGRSRGAGRGSAWCMAGQPLPAAPPAAARLRGSAAAERGELSPARGQRGGSPSSGSGRAAPGCQRLARILPASWRRRAASAGERRAATGTGGGAGWPPGGLEAAGGLGGRGVRKGEAVYSIWSLCS